jgi:hypothetical protein
LRWFSSTWLPHQLSLLPPLQQGPQVIETETSFFFLYSSRLRRLRARRRVDALTMDPAQSKTRSKMGRQGLSETPLPGPVAPSGRPWRRKRRGRRSISGQS